MWNSSMKAATVILWENNKDMSVFLSFTLNKMAVNNLLPGSYVYIIKNTYQKYYKMTFLHGFQILNYIYYVLVLEI